MMQNHQPARHDPWTNKEVHCTFKKTCGTIDFRQVGSDVKKPVVLALLGIMALSACAKNPNKIRPTYVSPTVYENSSCRSIIAERNRISKEVTILTDSQKSKSSTDTAAVAVGVIIFWPALFLLAVGDENEAQLSSYKGSYDALTQAGIKKRCFDA